MISPRELLKIAEEKAKAQSPTVSFLLKELSPHLKALSAEGYTAKEITRVLNIAAKHENWPIKRFSSHQIRIALEELQKQEHQQPRRGRPKKTERENISKQSEQSKQPKKFSFSTDEDDKPGIVKLHEQRKPKKF